MKSILYKYRLFIGIFLYFQSLLCGFFYVALKPSKSLPIFNPSDVNPG
jgi:protein SCO1/2